MRDLDAWLKALVSTLDTADRPLADEIRALRGFAMLTAPLRVPKRQLRRASPQPSLRNIVLRVGRPVLAIVGDTPQLQFSDSDSEVWRSRLQASSDRLQRAARAVGRIDVTGLPELEYVGTGWLVEKNTIVTNRHVAREFGRRMRGGFTFKKGAAPGRSRPPSTSLKRLGGPTSASFQSSTSSTSKTRTGRTSRCCEWRSRAAASSQRPFRWLHRPRGPSSRSW